MSEGTLYYSCESGEPLRTRSILPYSLVKHYKLNLELSGPDEHFPSEFPGRYVPALRFRNGIHLTESIPVALWLAEKIPRSSLLLAGDTAASRAQILQWMNIFNLELMNYIALQFTMVVGRIPYDSAAWDNATRCIDRQLSIIESHLTKNTYLVGETLTLADLYGCPMLLRALQKLWGPEKRAKYPALMRWFNTIKASAVYNGIFDDLELASESNRPN